MTALSLTRTRWDREAQTAVVLLAPTLLFFLVFQYYPIFKSLAISFADYGLLRRETPFVGLENYVRQFQDPLFLAALWNTLLFVGVCVVVGVALALVVAVLVEKTGRWAGVYRTLYFIPVVTSLMATAMIWRWLYASNGLINFLMTLVGLDPQAWLLSEHLALPSLIVLTIWKNLGFDLILFSAALQGIPEEMYEASSLDGANAWQTFFYITLPQLRPDRRARRDYGGDPLVPGVHDRARDDAGRAGECDADDRLPHLRAGHPVRRYGLCLGGVGRPPRARGRRDLLPTPHGPRNVRPTMNGRRHFLHRAAQAGLGLAAAPFVRPAAARPGALPAPERDDFWDLVRDLYPMTRERAYLNTGGLGPAPYPVLDAVERATTAQQFIVEHGHEQLEEIRGPVAAFFGARAEEIAFTRNATEGNATISSGLELKPGDEVIFESHAHPGGAFAWMSRQERDGIRVKIFEPDPTSAAGNLERIAALVTPKTRVIQVSHLTAPTGIRMPVDAIATLAHERDIWFHIDGAQSAGLIPVDLHAIGCDSYATSGHKWLGAPHGTGLLYVREDRLDDVWPTEVGAYSASNEAVHLPDTFAFVPTAQRFEPGTRDTASLLGFAAAVAFLDEIGMDRVAARAQHLGQYLQRGLRAIPGVTVLTPSDPALSAGMTTLKAERVPYDKLYHYYSEAHMRCRIVTERGLDAVRVSTHLFNSEAECDRVIAVTRDAIDTA